MRIGLVAGEASGDLLGASLMSALLKIYPDAEFSGIGGPKMLGVGMQNLYPMESLSVMGLVEVVKHLPELLKVRKSVLEHFRLNPPDVFIGIDSPDFNLPVERKLKQHGIKTVHYVSPTVWAWREGRTETIRKSVDLLLSLFPFETAFLKARHVPAAYIGHPLADQITLDVDRAGARKALGLEAGETVVAILPGSRRSEIEFLADDFIAAAGIMAKHYSRIQFIVPLVNQTVRQMFAQKLEQAALAIDCELLDGQAHTALAAADIALTASGTATLEVLLFKRPAVVAYRLNKLTYWIAKTFNLVKTPHIALSNLLAGERLVPEFIQDDIRPDALAVAAMEFIDNPGRADALAKRYREIHQQLRCDSSSVAARAVADLIEGKTG